MKLKLVDRMEAVERCLDGKPVYCVEELSEHHSLAMISRVERFAIIEEEHEEKTAEHDETVQEEPAEVAEHVEDVEIPTEVTDKVSDALDDYIEALPEHGKDCPKKKRKKPKKVGIDKGKIKALYEGGWSIAKIADELSVSPQTIYYHIDNMKAEGVIL